MPGPQRVAILVALLFLATTSTPFLPQSGRESESDDRDRLEAGAQESPGSAAADLIPSLTVPFAGASYSEWLALSPGFQDATQSRPSASDTGPRDAGAQTVAAGSGLCPLSNAVQKLYNSLGVEASPKDLRRLESEACALPSELQSPVARIVTAIAVSGAAQFAAWSALEPADQAAFAALSRSEGSSTEQLLQDPTVQAALARFDASATHLGAQRILAAIDDSRVELESVAAKARAGEIPLSVDGFATTSSDGGVIFADPTGLIIIGDTGSTEYFGAWNPTLTVPTVLQEEVAILIVELGGDDFYYNRLGGANILPRDFLGHGIPSAVIIEIDGDDRYDTLRGTSVGGGELGVGILVDMAGNDSMWCRSICQGGGRVGGVGILIDEAGSDYRSGGESQGFGFFKGVGLLVDLEGDDENWATSNAQGFAWGGFNGVGLTDQAVGIFLDYGGNDFYNLTVCCGRGYTAGAGAHARFMDKGGLDTYQMSAVANGAAGNPPGDALFIDEGPEIDIYDSPNYQCPCGNDISWTQGPGQGAGRDGLAARQNPTPIK